jgi:Uma2 family endonuclease
MATLSTYELSKPFVAVEEYLKTSYDPDCDYVDGRIEERNLGEYDHGYLQMLVCALFHANREAWGVKVIPELRTRVSGTRFRIPDVSVQRLDAPREQIPTHPPLIAIEILSPEDRLSRFQVRIDDYLEFGVENIWILDPETRRVWTADRAGMHLVQNGELSVPGTPIRVVLHDLFADLDRG